MFTKQADKLVQVIPQPDQVISMTYGEVVANLEWAKNRRDNKIAELAGAEQEVARFEEMLAKCTELGVAPVVEVIEEVLPESK